MFNIIRLFRVCVSWATVWLSWRYLVAGITIIALGTSLPDKFSNRTTAIHDEYADSAIGNITGHLGVLTSSLPSCFRALKSHYFLHNLVFSILPPFSSFMILYDTLLLCRKLLLKVLWHTCWMYYVRYSVIIKHMQVHTYMQAYTCTQTHTYTQTHTFTHTSTHTCVNTHTYVHQYTNKHTHRHNQLFAL